MDDINRRAAASSKNEPDVPEAIGNLGDRREGDLEAVDQEKVAIERPIEDGDADAQLV